MLIYNFTKETVRYLGLSWLDRGRQSIHFQKFNNVLPSIQLKKLNNKDTSLLPETSCNLKIIIFHFILFITDLWMTVQGLIAVIYLINLQITHLPLQNFKVQTVLVVFEELSIWVTPKQVISTCSKGLKAFAKYIFFLMGIATNNRFSATQYSSLALAPS